MDNKMNFTKLYQAYQNDFDELEQNFSLTNEFYDAFLKGDNKVFQKHIKETKEFDEEWIKTVESYIPSLNKIIMSPKNSLKQEEDIVNIEKAKKINSASIKHLAANTHFVKEVKDDGLVVPSKILTTFTEIDYDTYENRVIKTLIERLFFFVRNRYELIKENILSYETNNFALDSSFPLNDTDVTINVKISFKDSLESTKINEYNKNLLVRVEYLNKIVSSLYASDFMDKMKNSRKVNPPLMKTNIFLKDINYKNAYLLWIFLDRYNTLAFTIDVREKNLPFTSEYLTDINRQVLTMFSTVLSNQVKNKEKYDEIVPSKKRKKSIKVTTKHEDEINLTLENEQLEDNSLNEYYLQANKSLFKQSLDYHEKTSKTYETSVKRALRDTLDISNALYQSFFELDEEDDIFKRLITEIDVTKELTEARRKLIIAKMIREVKEVDFNNALRKERQLLREIAKFDGLLLKEANAELKLIRSQLAQKNRIMKEKKKVELESKLVEKKLKNTKQAKEKINAERIKTNKKIKEYETELKNKNKLELTNYKKNLDKIYKEELKAIEDKYKIEQRLTNAKLKQEIERLQKRLKAEKLKTGKKEAARLVKQKQSAIISKKKSNDTKSKKIISKYKENEANLNKLDSKKKEIDNSIVELSKFNNEDK